MTTVTIHPVCYGTAIRSRGTGQTLHVIDCTGNKGRREARKYARRHGWSIPR